MTTNPTDRLDRVTKFVEEYKGGDPFQMVAEFAEREVQAERARLKLSLYKVMQQSQSNSFYEWWDEEFGGDK